MERLSWSEAAGNVCWWGDANTWVGAWEREHPRQGIYVSARPSMVAFVLDGELAVELGPRRHAVNVVRGGALVVHERTPLRYTMAGGTRLLMTEATTIGAPGLGARYVAPGRVARRMAELLARVWGRPELHAGLTEAASELGASGAGTRLAFEPVHNTERLLAVKRYLEAHFQEPLRLREVARRFHMNHFYLSRAFALTTGVAPKVFVSALRREHFLRSLLASARSRSLTTLALDAGFDDYAAFCRWVKKELGAAPSQLLAGRSTLSKSPPSRVASFQVR